MIEKFAKTLMSWKRKFITPLPHTYKLISAISKTSLQPLNFPYNSNSKKLSAKSKTNKTINNLPKL